MDISSALMPPVDLILASASPRRRELLEQIGVRYRVLTHEIDESVLPDEAPADYVCRLALAKARSIGGPEADGRCVLGADTIVVCEGQILGKPQDRNDALRMLLLLSGRTHQVHTAVALCAGEQSEVVMSTTAVRFRKLTAEECSRYWETGEPQGKAGAYAIQGLAAVFVADVRGSYSGVVGLPLYETAELLRRFNVATGLTVPMGSSE